MEQFKGSKCYIKITEDTIRIYQVSDKKIFTPATHGTKIDCGHGLFLIAGEWKVNASNPNDIVCMQTWDIEDTVDDIAYRDAGAMAWPMYVEYVKEVLTECSETDWLTPIVDEKQLIGIADRK